ncbi:MAG: aminotransferase class V-fold PLP-dependent enzyme, partial [Paenibacillaceae bacterium]|nr:aminotransferase class V-fold PLP-dependent enzyme [Paenibacillaceae bacterium]
MPLVQALINYEQKTPLRLHVPGHSGKLGNIDVVRSWSPYDVTEITGLDALHAPSGIIAEAMRLAAHTFAVDETFFLVGGSTSGIHAALRTAARSGDTIVAARNVHMSVVHALALYGIKAIVVPPEQDLRTGTYTVPTCARLKEVLHDGVKAICIARPNYHGIATDIGDIVALAHEQGIPLIVDEAHGAHFGFHPSFPYSARQCGADLIVQSTHKMLPALTMGAMLHVQGDLVHRATLRVALRAVQTSSPSYVIMASLDAVRGQLDTFGPILFDRALHAITVLREKMVQECVRIRCFMGDGADPFKLLLYDCNGAVTGHRLARMLAEHECMCEMSDEKYAVCVWGVHHGLDDAHRLFRAIKRIDAQAVHIQGTKQDVCEWAPWDMSSEPISVRLFEQREIKSIPLQHAQGHLCAEAITPYPPGVPIVWPGERMS